MPFHCIEARECETLLLKQGFSHYKALLCSQCINFWLVFFSPLFVVYIHNLCTSVHTDAVAVTCALLVMCSSRAEARHALYLDRFSTVLKRNNIAYFVLQAKDTATSEEQRWNKFHNDWLAIVICSEQTEIAANAEFSNLKNVIFSLCTPKLPKTWENCS